MSEDALEENDTECLPAEEFNSSNSERQPNDEQTDDVTDQAEDPVQMLPNAENIWKSSMGSSAIQRSLKNQSATRTDGAKREHRWGGVWFMSPFRSRDYKSMQTPRITDNALPPAYILNKNHNITVDENLRMPSVWVEDCPEIVSFRPDSFHQRGYEPNKANTLKRSLVHVLSFVSIGLMTMLLAMIFFPGLFSLSFLEKDIDNLTSANTTQDALLASHSKESQDGALANKAPLKEISNIESAEKPSTNIAPESDDIQIADKETAPAIGDSYIDSYHYIKLATRYFVYFDFNKSSIPTKYESLLKSIRDKMLLEDNNFLKITGYADSQGNGHYNYQLSLKRAKKVKEYFALRGIADERLHVGAVGSVSNGKPQFESIAERRQIRRVEVILFPK